MEIHYFSWLRNRVGTAKENISLPDDVTTPQKLVDWLSAQDAKYKALFTYVNVINISVNGQVVEDWNNHEIKNSDSISFFSPMAGG